MFVGSVYFCGSSVLREQMMLCCMMVPFFAKEYL